MKNRDRLNLVCRIRRGMEQILIVEDDKGLNQGLCKALKAKHRQVVSCVNLKAAREQFLCSGVSLVLLDVNLPDGSGLDLLREIKVESPHLPVILLTANDTDMDIVDGLERGADDYITKPFSLSVLRARVNTQLRRAEELNRNCSAGVSGTYGGMYAAGMLPESGLGYGELRGARNVSSLGNELPVAIDHFIFDFPHFRFVVNGRNVELSKTEQKLLRLLVENRGMVMPRATLVDRIWTDGAEYVDENALSVTVKRLRDKLDAHDYIRTVYGVGYCWGMKDGT